MNLMIEVTRRCNMQCAHCLRGDAQNLDIGMTHIKALAKVLQGQEIDTLMFTGGEPLLAIERMNMIFDIFKAQNVSWMNFWLSTNGKVWNREIETTLLKYFQAATDGEINSLQVSRDQYHYANRSHKWDIKEFCELNNIPLNETGSNPYGVIPMGRGASNSLSHNNKNVYFDNLLYITAKGQVLMTCELSFEIIDKINEGSILGNKDLVMALLEDGYNLDNINYEGWDINDAQDPENIFIIIRAWNKFCNRFNGLNLSIKAKKIIIE